MNQLLALVLVGSLVRGVNFVLLLSPRLTILYFFLRLLPLTSHLPSSGALLGLVVDTDGNICPSYLSKAGSDSCMYAGSSAPEYFRNLVVSDWSRVWTPSLRLLLR